MTMTIVEAGRGVTGGVDTHLDVHVAAALDPLGGLLGAESFSTDAAGYKRVVRRSAHDAWCRVEAGTPARAATRAGPSW